MAGSGADQELAPQRDRGSCKDELTSTFDLRECCAHWGVAAPVLVHGKHFQRRAQAPNGPAVPTFPSGSFAQKPFPFPNGEIWKLFSVLRLRFLYFLYFLGWGQGWACGEGCCHQGWSPELNAKGSGCC